MAPDAPAATPAAPAAPAEPTKTETAAAPAAAVAPAGMLPNRWLHPLVIGISMLTVPEKLPTPLPPPLPSPKSLPRPLPPPPLSRLHLQHPPLLLLLLVCHPYTQSTSKAHN